MPLTRWSTRPPIPPIPPRRSSPLRPKPHYVLSPDGSRVPQPYSAGRHTPPFADDGYGDFLADTSQTLFGHQPTLCAACNLTSAEFALIADWLGFGPATPLTIENVSALFRFGWLAHTLGLSVLDFSTCAGSPALTHSLRLTRAPRHPAEPPVIRFPRLLSSCASAGLTTAQALYLMWNQDISGGSAPTTADVTGLASALRADFAGVEAQFTLQDDPDGSVAQGLMTLVYGSTASDFFFGLPNDTFSTVGPYSSPPGQPGLPAPVLAAASGQLSYDDLSRQLSYAGVLDQRCPGGHRHGHHRQHHRRHRQRPGQRRGHVHPRLDGEHLPRRRAAHRHRTGTGDRDRRQHHCAPASRRARPTRTTGPAHRSQS